MDMNNSSKYRQMFQLRETEVLDSGILKAYAMDGNLIYKVIHHELYPQIFIAVTLFVLFVISRISGI